VAARSLSDELASAGIGPGYDHIIDGYEVSHAGAYVGSVTVCHQKVSIHGYRRSRGLPSSGAGSRVGLRCLGLGSARGRTDRDGDGRFSRAWRGDLEGDAGRPGDDDAAGEAGEARPAYRQPDRVPRSCEESLA
jgi:hypothetical protein